MTEFTANFKAGPKLDAAWIVIKSDTAEGLAKAIEEAQTLSLDVRVRVFNELFSREQVEWR